MRKIYFVIVMLLLGTTLNAQQSQKEPVAPPERAYYFQLIGGFNYPLMENIRFFSPFNSIRPSTDFSLGIEFNPYWSGSASFGYKRNWRIYDEWHQGSPTYYESGYNSLEFFLDGAYNLTNGVKGFDPLRKSNLYIYVGAGLVYTYGREPIGEEAFNGIFPGVRGGLTYSYAFTARFAAIGDLGFDFFPDNFNNFKTGIPIDSRFHCQVGIRMYLDTKGAERWVREPEIQYVEKVIERRDTVLIEKLISRRDTIRITDRIEGEIMELPTKLQTIFFAINSSEVRNSELHKIEDIATYMKEHPEKVVLVIGSADRQTGNEEINSRLRTDRAHSVADILVEKYGVQASRVKTLAGKSAKEDLYRKQYEKNRAAICIVIDFDLE